MKMNLQSTKFDYMYFNEVLFGFYKILYTKSRGFLKGTKKAGLQQIEDSEQKTLDIIQALKAKVTMNLINRIIRMCLKRIISAPFIRIKRV
jgi:hypothetical protein